MLCLLMRSVEISQVSVCLWLLNVPNLGFECLSTEEMNTTGLHRLSACSPIQAARARMTRRALLPRLKLIPLNWHKIARNYMQQSPFLSRLKLWKTEKGIQQFIVGWYSKSIKDWGKITSWWGFEGMPGKTKQKILKYYTSFSNPCQENW